MVFSLLAPEKGSKWAFEFEVIDSSESLIELSGEGTMSGEKRSGTLEGEIDGVDLGVLQLKNVVIENQLRGELSGTFSYALDELGIIDELEEEFEYIAKRYDSVEKILDEIDTAVIEVSVDSTQDKASVTLALKLGEKKPEELIAVTTNVATNSGENVKIPSNTVDITDEDDLLDWAEDLAYDDILADLEKKGVPEDSVDALEMIVDLYLD